MSDSASQVSSKKYETVIIAIIGLVGVLFTAVASNWDKLFYHTVTATYTGYQPTGNIETEIRYLLEVNGTRAGLKEMQDGMIESAKAQLVAADPTHPEKTQKFLDFLRKNTPSYEDTLGILIPLWEKHFNLEEVQELNRFFSTPQMQQMVSAQPQVIREMNPILMKNMQDLENKLMKAIQDGEFENHETGTIVKSQP
jgi:Uncharacterized protein conserved in bacteria (DUF2059)